MIRNSAAILLLILMALCSAGCVSEAVNKSIGNAMNDPQALQTPENPDEPIFDPQSERLIERNQTDETMERFYNR